MNILHITTHLNEGGIASYIAALAIEFSKLGHNIIVASSGGNKERLLLNNSVKVIRIPICTKSELSPRVLFSYFILKRYLARNKIDIIHAHTRVTQVLAFLLAAFSNVQIVTTCHGFFRPRWHRRIFPCWGNKVIAISNQVKNHLVNDFNRPEKNIAIIHSGVDLQRFSVPTQEKINSIKSEMGIEQYATVIGSAARFSDVKGLDFFIRAIPLIGNNNNDIVFLLIGYGKEEKRLRQLSKDIGVEDKLIFYRPQRQISEYLCVMNIFVMPSVQEGLGLSILEAQAQRIPVVASSVGGIPDIIEHNVTGVLISPKDEGQIARAVNGLLNDAVCRKRLQAKAYDKLAENFSLQKMVGETEKVYQELV